MGEEFYAAETIQRCWRNYRARRWARRFGARLRERNRKRREQRRQRREARRKRSEARNGPGPQRQTMVGEYLHEIRHCCWFFTCGGCFTDAVECCTELRDCLTFGKCEDK